MRCIAEQTAGTLLQPPWGVGIKLLVVRDNTNLFIDLALMAPPVIIYH